MAGLPQRGWHVYRHSFATDTARYGVNPFTLMRWMGHKTLKQTLEYIDVAKAHQRPISEAVRLAGEAERDPDEKVIAMLGARWRGNSVATVLRR